MSRIGFALGTLSAGVRFFMMACCILLASAGCSGGRAERTAKRQQAISQICDPTTENCCPEGYTEHLLSDDPDVYVSGTAELCICGGDGSDTVMAGPKNLVIGGPGSDTINAYQGGTVIPGAGLDTVSVSGGATVEIYDLCEAPAGETLSGGGDGTLIAPVSEAELRQRQVNVSGFSRVIVQQNSCKSECVTKPNCSGHGVCAEGARSGEVVCRCSGGYTGANCEIAPTIPPDSEALVTSAEIGRLEGESSVEPSGAFTYRLPLEVPRGRAGMEPQLALTYNSNVNANGPLGVGWALQGLSAITRCKKTVAAEGDASGINIDAHVFCLDGEKLVRVGGSDTEREFRTERDSFARIIAKYAGDAPDDFTVWHKDGRISIYKPGPRVIGPRSSTPAILSWHLASTSDRFGNGIVYRYQAANPGIESAAEVPLEIFYTVCMEGFPCPYRGPTRSVRFEYEPRPDYVSRWVAARPGGLSVRLSKVSVYTLNGPDRTLVRTYKLRYDLSKATSRSRLSGVTLCDGQGKCLPELWFKWGAGRGQNFRPKWIVMGPDANPPQPVPGQCMGTELDCEFNAQFISIGEQRTSSQYLVGDFDGNGVDDVLFTNAWWPDRDDHGLEVLFFNDRGLQQRTRVSPSPSQISTAHALVVDIDQDGQSELLYQSLDDPRVHLLWRLNNATRDFELVKDPTGKTITYPSGNSNPYPPPSFMDINGDGVLDYFFDSGISDATARTFYKSSAVLGTNSLFPISYTEPILGGYLSSPRTGRDGCQLQALDMNGSGESILTEICDTGDDGLTRYVDLNGDGIQDSVTIRTGPDPLARARLSYGTVFSPYGGKPEDVQTAPYQFPAGAFQSANTHTTDDRLVRVADFDGDGLTDILQYATVNTRSDHFTDPPIIWFSRNVSDTSTTIVPQKLPTTHKRERYRGAQIGDFNGDGLPDIVQTIDKDSDGNSVFQFLIQESRNRDDVITQVANGTASLAEVYYAREPLGEIDIDRNDRTPHCASPKTHCPRRGLTVVGAAEFTRGGAEESYYYYYDKPAVDVAGRGFLGFETFTVVDRVRARRTTTLYENTRMHGQLNARHSYPFAFVPHQIDIVSGQHAFDGLDPSTSLVPNNAHMVERFTKVVFDNQLHLTNNSQTYFVDRASVVELHYQGEPLAFFRATSVYEKRDDYGTVTERTVNDEGTTKTVYVPNNNTTEWLIGKIDTETTTSQRANQTEQQQRKTKFVYGSKGELTQVIEFPDDPELETVTTITPDAAGLPRLVSARDKHGNSRSLSHDYSTDGVFPQSTKNSLGHETWTGFHSGLGVPLVTYDINNRKTLYKYDGFGRPAEVIPTRGAKTIISYSEPRSRWLAVEAWQIPGTKTVEKYDEFGRLRFESTFIEGKSAEVNYRYDRLGRVLSTHAPHFAGTPQPLESTYEYDNLEQLRLALAPDGAKTQVNILDGLSTEIVTTTDRVRRQKVTRTPDGLVASTREFGSDGTRGVDFEYGPFKTLRKVIELGGPSTEYRYDARGNRTLEINPESGTTKVLFTGFGEPRRMEQLASNPATVWVWDHDAVGRVKRVGVTGENPTIFVYDVGTGAVGQLSSAISPDGVETGYTYTPEGLPSEATHIAGADVFRIKREYDLFGRLSHLHYPEVPGRPRFSIDAHYNDDPVSGDGTMMVVERGTDELWRANGRHASGIVEFSRLSGLAQEVAIDPNTLKVTDLRTYGPAAQVFGIHYDYHTGGNVKTRIDSFAGTTDGYEYDDYDQLKTWSHSAASQSFSRVFTYDHLGNHKGHQGITKNFGERGHSPHAITSLTLGGETRMYDYDELGRQTSMMVNGQTRRAITYTPFDLPRKLTHMDTSSHTQTYEYDAFQQKFRVKSDSSSTTYVGDLYERRVAASGAAQHVFYVSVDGGTIQTIYDEGTGLETTLPLLPDLHGSASSTGAGEAQAFSPWGERLQSSSGISGVTLGFTGHEHEDASGVINMRGRIYDPVAAAFLTPDPIVSAPGSAVGWNAYAYVLNNPIAFVDPTGFSPTSEAGYRDTPNEYGTWDRTPSNGQASSPKQGQASPATSSPTLPGSPASSAPNYGNGQSYGNGFTPGYALPDGTVPATTSGVGSQTPIPDKRRVGPAEPDPRDKAERIAERLRQAPDERKAEVTVRYNRKTGKLTVTDDDTGERVVVDVESGGKPKGDPIPKGEWEILEHARKKQFRLDFWDNKPRDDVHEPTGRSNFRLHGPGNTIGCIACKDSAAWKKVWDLISRTKTSTVKDNAASWWKGSSPIKKFGNLTVE